MPHRIFWIHLFVLVCLVCVPLGSMPSPTWAAVDPYIIRYLRVTEPVSLELDGQGHSQLFTPDDLTVGKQLFERNCLNCHVGGTTLPNPLVSLALKDLQAANPRRDTIAGLVTYFRQPMTYDGSEENFWCRQVPESWLAQQEVEQLASFVLQAAHTAPGWGTETFTGDS